MIRYNISGRKDDDGDEIPPIIEKDKEGYWCQYDDVKVLEDKLAALEKELALLKEKKAVSETKSCTHHRVNAMCTSTSYKRTRAYCGDAPCSQQPHDKYIFKIFLKVYSVLIHFKNVYYIIDT